ncbi:hypothetical protein KI387_010304 [Taxus chinensis]|uniref:Uncharacterized protein n=1 Tax=Taxus chinensis TaxID=29808 RepID=A0AA38KUK2_TAXCH|nr:hypothetical protein KI387_010304 [Taxus chinensis]
MEKKKETFPALISDSKNRVKWANSAYKKMVGQPECSCLESTVCCYNDNSEGPLTSMINGEVVLKDESFPASALGLSASMFHKNVPFPFQMVEDHLFHEVEKGQQIISGASLNMPGLERHLHMKKVVSKPLLALNPNALVRVHSNGNHSGGFSMVKLDNYIATAPAIIDTDAWPKTLRLNECNHERDSLQILYVGISNIPDVAEEMFHLAVGDYLFHEVEKGQQIISGASLNMPGLERHLHMKKVAWGARKLQVNGIKGGGAAGRVKASGGWPRARSRSALVRVHGNGNHSGGFSMVKLDNYIATAPAIIDTDAWPKTLRLNECNHERDSLQKLYVGISNIPDVAEEMFHLAISYHAARAYDCAVYCLKDAMPTSIFPHFVPEIPSASSLSPAQIQVIAAKFTKEEFSHPLMINATFSHPQSQSHQIILEEHNCALLDSFLEEVEKNQSPNLEDFHEEDVEGVNFVLLMEEQGRLIQDAGARFDMEELQQTLRKDGAVSCSESLSSKDSHQILEEQNCALLDSLLEDVEKNRSLNLDKFPKEDLEGVDFVLLMEEQGALFLQQTER